MDRNSGLEAKISGEETRTTTMTDLGEIPQPFIRVSLQGQTLPMGTTDRTTEDHMLSDSLEMMEILSRTQLGNGETMEISLVLRRLKETTSHKIISIANQELTNLITLRSADLTIELRLFLRLMNKNFRKTII